MKLIHNDTTAVIKRAIRMFRWKVDILKGVKQKVISSWIYFTLYCFNHFEKKVILTFLLVVIFWTQPMWMINAAISRSDTSNFKIKEYLNFKNLQYYPFVYNYNQPLNLCLTPLSLYIYKKNKDSPSRCTQSGHYCKFPAFKQSSGGQQV